MPLPQFVSDETPLKKAVGERVTSGEREGGSRGYGTISSIKTEQAKRKTDAKKIKRRHKVIGRRGFNRFPSNFRVVSKRNGWTFPQQDGEQVTKRRVEKVEEASPAV